MVEQHICDGRFSCRNGYCVNGSKHKAAVVVSKSACDHHSALVDIDPATEIITFSCPTCGVFAEMPVRQMFEFRLLDD